MYQKDYILRMLEMIRELIMGILGLIKKGDLEKAGDQLDRLYYDFLKEDSAFFTMIPAGDLTEKLLHEHNYSNGHLEILALLFDTEAELELARGNRTLSLDFSRKSLIILEYIDNEQKTYSAGRMGKMTSIRNRIKSLQ